MFIYFAIVLHKCDHPDSSSFAVFFTSSKMRAEVEESDYDDEDQIDDEELTIAGKIDVDNFIRNEHESLPAHEVVSSPWYYDAQFQPYWNHYRSVHHWFQRHTEYVNNLATVSAARRPTAEEWHRSLAEYHSRIADMISQQYYSHDTAPDNVRQSWWNCCGDSDARQRPSVPHRFVRLE